MHKWEKRQAFRPITLQRNFQSKDIGLTFILLYCFVNRENMNMNLSSYKHKMSYKPSERVKILRQKLIFLLLKQNSSMVLDKASGSGYESGYTKYKQELIIFKLRIFSFTLMGSFKLNRARILFLGKLSLGIKLHPCCVWSIVKLFRAGLRIRTARKTGSRSGRIKFLKTHGIFCVTVK